MARTNPNSGSRRVLNDQEIRYVWAALELLNVPACYRGVCEVLLSSYVTRRNEAILMTSDELDRSVWVIPGSRSRPSLIMCFRLSGMHLGLIGDSRKGCQKNFWFVFFNHDEKKTISGVPTAKRGSAGRGDRRTSKEFRAR